MDGTTGCHQEEQGLQDVLNGFRKHLEWMSRTGQLGANKGITMQWMIS